MEEERVNRIYKLYDLFNDFNRVYILIELYNNELTVEELNERTNIKNIVIFHQLEYLINKKVVKKKVIDEIEKYSIVDKTLNKVISNMKNYVIKK